ncbi:MAG: ATP-grasp domain-containing protein [Deltaproteobacteria bacterium]|jgi:carbamoyl-phosphate synthase large subunit|nr:ATP-grasp domain-containing protein [Deltaproteobacteria bacterium]
MDRFEWTIGVTGLNATDNPGPGISVIRSLRAHPGFNGKIIGLAYHYLDPGLYASDLIDSAYLIPLPSEGVQSLRQRLEYIKTVTDLSMLIPTLDSEMSGFISLEPELREIGIRMFLPTQQQYDIRSKIRLAEICEKTGFDYPQTRIVSDIESLFQVSAEISFPYMLKGIFYGASLVKTMDEASMAFHRTVAQWGLPVIIQEFLIGEEYDVLAVGDGKGEIVGGLSMKKTSLTDKGKGWAGVVVNNPKFLTMAETFCQVTKWRGPFEMEILKTKDERYFLIEINPRFPAWTYLCVGADQNLPVAVAQLAMGVKPQSLPESKAGTMFVRISLEQVVKIDRLEEIISKGEIHYR